MTPFVGEASAPCAPELVREVRDLAVWEHGRFESEVWARLPEAAVPGVPQPPSYHNERHVAAVCDCIDAVFDACDAGTDPFGLASEARRWSDGAGADGLGPGTLRTAMGVAFACHDLGNISATDVLDLPTAGPGLGLSLARIYDSSALYGGPAVEARSAAIARAVLAAKGGDCGRSAALARLVEHLVLQTVFHFEKVSDDAPFWTAMQVVDMIGSYFFLSVPRLEAVAGLFAEMRVQKPGAIPILPFLTSLEERFDRLVPDAGRRRQVLEIFEGNARGRTGDAVFSVPERFRGMTKPVPYDEAIRALLAPG